MTKCMTCFAALVLLLALGCGDEGEGSVRAGPTAETGGGSASAADTPGAGGTGDLFLDGFFPIGQFIPYPTEFTMHTDRGINTAVEIPDLTGDVYTPQQWDDAVIAEGWKVIRSPVGDLATDAAKPHLLAWSQEDEPDVYAMDDPAVIPRATSNYSDWKAASPSTPVYVTFGGGNVLMPTPYDCNGLGDEGGPLADCYDQLIGAADWVGHDIYPVNGWLWDESTRGDISQIGLALDKLRGVGDWSIEWQSGPVFAFVEGARCCDTWGAQHATPAETRAEIWNAIIHGARGIFYFTTEVEPGFSWDNMAPDVEVEVTYQNGIITQLSNVLQDEINPTSLGTTLSSNSLEAGWRDTPSGKYFFVLNKTADAVNGATVTLTGIGDATSATVYDEARSETIVGGMITDDFPAHERHIYVIAP